jgi:hypothetical protein
VATLLTLAEHAGEVVTKATLIDRVWPEGFVGEANLTQNIYVLRKNFRESGFPQAIETVAATGYRLKVPVHKREPAAVKRGSAFPGARAAGLVAAMLAVALVSLVAASSAVHGKRGEPGIARIPAQSYAIGRYYLNLRTRDGVRKSLDYFTRAIDADPYDASSYAAMADANVVMGD